MPSLGFGRRRSPRHRRPGCAGAFTVAAVAFGSRIWGQTMDVGFIGLGQMGAGMAASLLRAGHRVTVYNRTPQKAAPLVAQGARAAASVAEACRGEAVITMLADDAAVEGIVLGPEGVLAHLPAGRAHVSSSTIGVGLSRRLAAAHGAARQRYVAAPVFGRPEAAADRQLLVVAAGESGAIAAAQPLLDAIGQRTVVISADPSAANLVKLSGNFLIASVLESLGEAVALIAKGGIDRQQYIELMTSTLFSAPVYKTYGGLIAAGRFSPPAFAAPLGAKDIRLALAAAEELRVPMPLASLLRDRLLTLLAHGGEHLDWSAIGALPAQDAGLPSA